MALEQFTDVPAGAVSSGGTTAPAPGTSQSWTVTTTSVTAFPGALAAGTPPTIFHVADPALPSETIAVTNVSGTTWTVTRGVDGTTPVAHTAGFTVYQVVSAGALGMFPQVYSVRSVTYGAKGDGSTDDTTAIQAALTACRLAGGGTVYVPEGTYIVSSMLQIGSGTTLQGAGAGATTIRAKSGSWAGVAQIGSINGLGVLITYNNASASNITVTGLTVDGNEAGITAIPSWAGTQACGGLHINNVTGLTIRACKIMNTIGYTVYLQSDTNFQVLGSTVTSGQSATWGLAGSPTQQDGIHLDACTYGTVSGNNVDTGVLVGAGDDAIAVQAYTGTCHDITISGNVCRAAANGVDIALGAASGTANIFNIAITGNDFWQSYKSSISNQIFQGTTSISYNVTISGNTFAQWGAASAAAILVLDYPGALGTSGNGWAGWSVTGNTFTNPQTTTGTVMLIEGGSDLVVAGNTIYNCNSYFGIQVGNFGALQETVTNFTITGNSIDQSTATAGNLPVAIELFYSTYGTVSGNTLLGNSDASSAGIYLLGGTTHVAVSGNSARNFGFGLQETTSTATPGLNVISGNSFDGCTIPFQLLTAGGADSVYGNTGAGAGRFTLTTAFTSAPAAPRRTSPGCQPPCSPALTPLPGFSRCTQPAATPPRRHSPGLSAAPPPRRTSGGRSPGRRRRQPRPAPRSQPP